MILIWSIGDGTPIGAAWASISKIWYAAWSPLARRRRCRSYAWWPSIGKTCDWAKNWDFSEAIYQETSGYRCVCFLILKWWFNGVEPKKSTYISDFLCFFFGLSGFLCPFLSLFVTSGRINAARLEAFRNKTVTQMETRMPPFIPENPWDFSAECLTFWWEKYEEITI